MKLYTALNPTEAHILCELLKTEGIQCEVRGEGLFGLQGEIPISPDTGAYIWLMEPIKMTEAQRIIQDYERQRTSVGPDWYCLNCGESNEALFGICWNCGRPAENR